MIRIGIEITCLATFAAASLVLVAVAVLVGFLLAAAPAMLPGADELKRILGKDDKA